MSAFPIVIEVKTVYKIKAQPKIMGTIVAYVLLKEIRVLQWRWPAKRRSIRVCLDLFVTFWGNAKK
jgi:hypothetical protein